MSSCLRICDIQYRYIFQIVFNFGGGAVDISFDFPQHHGLDVGPEVHNKSQRDWHLAPESRPPASDLAYRCSMIPSFLLDFKLSTRRRSHLPLLTLKLCDRAMRCGFVARCKQADDAALVTK